MAFVQEFVSDISKVGSWAWHLVFPEQEKNPNIISIDLEQNKVSDITTQTTWVPPENSTDNLIGGENGTGEQPENPSVGENGSETVEIDKSEGNVEAESDHKPEGYSGNDQEGLKKLKELEAQEAQKSGAGEAGSQSTKDVETSGVSSASIVEDFSNEASGTHFTRSVETLASGSKETIEMTSKSGGGLNVDGHLITHYKLESTYDGNGVVTEQHLYVGENSGADVEVTNGITSTGVDGGLVRETVQNEFMEHSNAASAAADLTSDSTSETSSSTSESSSKTSDTSSTSHASIVEDFDDNATGTHFTRAVETLSSGSKETIEMTSKSGGGLNVDGHLITHYKLESTYDGNGVVTDQHLYIGENSGADIEVTNGFTSTGVDGALVRETVQNEFMERSSATSAAADLTSDSTSETSSSTSDSSSKASDTSSTSHASIVEDFDDNATGTHFTRAVETLSSGSKETIEMTSKSGGGLNVDGHLITHYKLESTYDGNGVVTDQHLYVGENGGADVEVVNGVTSTGVDGGLVRETVQNEFMQHSTGTSAADFLPDADSIIEHINKLIEPRLHIKLPTHIDFLGGHFGDLSEHLGSVGEHLNFLHHVPLGTTFKAAAICTCCFVSLQKIDGLGREKTVAESLASTAKSAAEIVGPMIESRASFVASKVVEGVGAVADAAPKVADRASAAMNLMRGFGRGGGPTLSA